MMNFFRTARQSVAFMPLAWRTWRYLQLDIKTADQPLHIDNLRSWFTAFPFEERAHFQSDDPSLSPIWQIGWRTARLDAHDTYMDTPYYERMQYIGDTRIQALISYSVAGDDRLARQAIQAFNDSRISDGITRSRYPTSVTQIIPTFSLLWVGMVHDFWRYRGDEQFVKAQIPGTRTVLDWFIASKGQTDSWDTSRGGHSSIGEKILPSVCLPKMPTADLLPSRFSTLKRFVTAQSWNQPSETRFVRNVTAKPKIARSMRSANCAGTIPTV